MSNATSVGMPGAGTIRDMRQEIGGGPANLNQVEVGLTSKHPIKQMA